MPAKNDANLKSAQNEWFWFWYCLFCDVENRGVHFVVKIALHSGGTRTNKFKFGKSFKQFFYFFREYISLRRCRLWKFVWPKAPWCVAMMCRLICRYHSLLCHDSFVGEPWSHLSMYSHDIICASYDVYLCPWLRLGDITLSQVRDFEAPKQATASHPT